MQPVVLHLDTEKGFRGGQQQALYLHTQLLHRKIESYFAVPQNSYLQAKLEIVKKSCLPYSFSGELDFVAGYRLAKFAKKHKVNILHAHSGHALALALWIKLFLPGVIIVGSRRVDFCIHGFFSKCKYRAADKIICISQEIKKVMLTCGIKESKLKVVYSGVDLFRFKDSVPNYNYLPDRNAFVIGTVAALTGHKDYPTLLKAAEICLQQESQLFFVSLGDGPDKERITALAQEEPLKSRFLFLGHKAEVGQYLKTFRIFVMASKKEGLGTSVIDAMALGLPIVATNAGGIPELINDNVNGLLVEKQNPQKLAGAILLLAKNKNLATKLGEQSKSEAQKFSMQKMVDGNLALYRELLHG